MTILGTAPGHIRHRITNLGEQDWRGLVFAAESRDAPPAETADTTAALAYPAADLTPKGGSEVKEVEGEKVIEHASLTAGWLTILNSEHTTHGHLTHAGIRRLWLRAEDLGEEAGDVELRLRYRSLGSLAWTTNRIVPSPLVDDWQWLDMGECRLDAAVLGDERWEFEVQARAPGGSGKVRLHRVAPLPTEQYVVVTGSDAPQSAAAQAVQSPGTVVSEKGSKNETGEVAWSEPTKAKTSDNSRTAAELDEANLVTEYLKATDFGFDKDIPEGAQITGVVVGIEGRVSGSASSGCRDHRVRLVIGGKVLDPAQGEDKASPNNWASSDEVKLYGGSEDTWKTEPSLIRADVIAEGFGVAVSAKLADGATDATPEIDHIYMVIYFTEQTDENRICFAGRSMEIRSDGVYRQHRTDDTWGKIVPFGSYPTAPPSGLEERPYRAIIIPSQGDLETIADSGANPLSAQTFHRPGYQYAREAAA